jgi:hypothetical protein
MHMSTQSLNPPKSLSHPLSRQTLLIAGVIVAIVIAATVLLLTTGTSARPVSPRAVTASPVSAPAGAADHPTGAGRTGTALGGFR